MKDLVYQFLKKNKEAVFSEIWTYISEQMLPSWKVRFSSLTEKKIQKIKIGEVYNILTIEGEFVLNKDNKWSLFENYSYSDIKKMKINTNAIEE